MLNRLKRSAFVRNVAVLVSGTALAQGMTLAAAPILSRLYSPDEFGILGLFLAVSAILRVAGCWRYQVAIVLPKDNEDAANILALACSILAFMTLLSAMIMALAGDWIVKLLDSPEFAPLIWWIPLAVLVAGLYDVLASWATRRKNFGSISVSQITHSGGIAGAQTLAGLAEAGPLGLVGGRIAGQFFANLVLGGRIYRQDRTLIYSAIKIDKVMEMAREHRKFPMYAMPQNVLQVISQNLLVFMLIYFFDPTVAGLYWFAARLMRAPSRLISTSVNRVFYQNAVEIYHKDGDLFSALKRVTLGLMALGFVPTAVVLAFGPVLFDIIFGPAWLQAGVYAQWLVIWWFFNFINSPSRRLMPIFGLQHILLVYEVGFMICTSLAILLGVFWGNEILAIASYSIVGALFNISLMLYIFLITGKAERAKKA